MKHLIIQITTALFIAIAIHLPVHAGGKDDPLLTMLRIDQLEVRKDGGETPAILEAEAWLGHDLKKLWLTADIEYRESEFEEAVFDVLYGQSIAPYWDIRAGLRQNTKPESETWAVLSLKGLAPYYFDIDSSLAVNGDGQSHININAEYEARLTQQWVLSPELDLNVYGKTDKQDSIGSGISDVNLGLRLRYGVRREFAPYIGINWTHKFGKTKEFAKTSGTDAQDTQFLLGVSMWF